jgi:putative ABC transport system permease protein
VTRARSSAELAAVARILQQQYPATNAGIGAVVDPIVEAMGGGGVRFVMGMLILMAALLLVVACANVANVMLARAGGRRRELAVRAAIGASRLRLVRQLMIEDLVLSILGGAAGLLLCTWEVDAVKTIAGREMTILSDLAVDWRVLVFALSVSLAAPLVFGLLPALRSSGLDVRDSLKETAVSVAGGPRGRRLRNVLVGCQVAMALTLLIQVGVLARSTIALGRVDNGFDPNGVLTLRIDLPAAAYQDPRRTQEFFDALIARLEALPGVQSVGAISRLPVTTREVPTRFTVEGRAPGLPAQQPWAALVSVSADYRRTMRIPLLQGRDLTWSTAPGTAPAALISRFAARRYWPGEDPIGKRIRLEGVDTRWMEIAGVVGDVRNSDVDAGVIPQIYVRHSDVPERAMAIVVRGEGDVASLTGVIRAQVAALDRDQPIYSASTMTQVLYDDLASTYILVGMVVALAVIALGLAAAGIYGVIAYAVTQRTHEIGVRMALGAQARDVRRMLIAQGLTPVAVGGAVGLTAGLALVRATATVLTEVNSRDPATYGGVLLLLALVSLLASYLPARRATAIDPVAALRAE